MSQHLDQTEQDQARGVRLIMDREMDLGIAKDLEIFMRLETIMVLEIIMALEICMDPDLGPAGPGMMDTTRKFLEATLG